MGPDAGRGALTDGGSQVACTQPGCQTRLDAEGRRAAAARARPAPAGDPARGRGPAGRARRRRRPITADLSIWSDEDMLREPPEPRRRAAAGRSRRSAARWHSPPGSRGRRPGPARWPWRCARGRAPRRPARGRARTRSPAALDRAVAREQVRCRPRPCQPSWPAKSRWTPPKKWPDLPDEREGGHDRARSGRPPSGSRWRSRAGPRWPLQSAAATSRGVPARGSVVVSLRSRRCSCRAGTSCSRPASTSRAAIGNGRFSAVHQWPDLGVHRGISGRTRRLPPKGRHRCRRLRTGWKASPPERGRGRLRLSQPPGSGLIVGIGKDCPRCSLVRVGRRDGYRTLSGILCNCRPQRVHKFVAHIPVVHEGKIFGQVQGSSHVTRRRAVSSDPPPDACAPKRSRRTRGRATRTSRIGRQRIVTVALPTRSGLKEGPSDMPSFAPGVRECLARSRCSAGLHDGLPT